MALVLLSIVTDALGSSTFSFYLLLATVPAIVVAGLAAVEGVRSWRAESLADTCC